jgi:hypothetical protein
LGLRYGRIADDLDPVSEPHTLDQFWQLVKVLANGGRPHKGFGCRPGVAIRARSEGRRPKASQEGTRGLVVDYCRDLLDPSCIRGIARQRWPETRIQPTGVKSSASSHAPQRLSPYSDDAIYHFSTAQEIADASPEPILVTAQTTFSLRGMHRHQFLQIFQVPIRERRSL